VHLALLEGRAEGHGALRRCAPKTRDAARVTVQPVDDEEASPCAHCGELVMSEGLAHTQAAPNAERARRLVHRQERLVLVQDGGPSRASPLARPATRAQPLELANSAFASPTTAVAKPLFRGRSGRACAVDLFQATPPLDALAGSAPASSRGPKAL